MQKQILIVEDNEINRSILNEILSSKYQVLEAENGLQALELVRQHRDSISLILLDVMMPVMDGYTFLDQLKDDAARSSPSTETKAARTTPFCVPCAGSLRKSRKWNPRTI